MLMRILAPRRPYPAPVAGTFPGAFLSLTAHAALLATVVGGDGAATRAAARAARVAASGGEQLHWVGVREGSGAAGARPHAGVRPPIAYVVPGHGAPRYAQGSAAAGPGLAGPNRGARRAAGPGASPPALALRPNPRRTSPLPLRPPAAALADVTMPDLDATRLVAGVLAAAPDLARRVSRPEDFVPAPAALMADLLARTGVGALALLHPDVHVNDVPIPLVSNPTPAYPAGLARAGVDGQVVVEFLIDSTGAVDQGSLRVVESTNALFAQAVRGVLPRLHFMPAQRGEHAVGVTVRQPFLFRVRPGL